MSNDEFVREVTTLVDALLGDVPINYDWRNDAPDQWYCTLCGETLPVTYLSPQHTTQWLFPETKPCPVETFPHREVCPVTLARRLQYYVR